MNDRLTITDTSMASDATRHTATVVPGAVVEGGPTAWEATWLPGRLLTRNQAITAMTLAEAAAGAARGAIGEGHRLWLHIDSWAGELGLTRAEAVAMASAEIAELEGATAPGEGK